jgi:hypothetical protein
MESAIVFICSAFCLGFDFQQSQLLCLHSVRTQTVPNQTQSQFPVFYSPYRMIDAGLIDVDTGKNTQIAVSGWWNPIRIHKKNRIKMVRVARLLNRRWGRRLHGEGNSHIANH